jgi:bis(5'-nucleosidyl)-tetraphosphatase
MKQDFSFGIIPLQKQSSKWHVFVIKHTSGHWAFPKGHKENIENPLQTAKRELFEETGLTVNKLLSDETLTSSYFFLKKNQRVEKTVTYFIAEVEGTISLDRKEVVEGKWLEFSKAINLLTYQESKNILNKVNHLLNLS